MLILARAACSEFKILPANFELLTLTKHVNNFDIKLVAHVMGRQHSFGSFKSLSEIGGSLRADLEKEGIDVSQAKQFPASWVLKVADTQQLSSTSILSRSGSVDASAQLALLNKKGREVDGTATHNDTEKVFAVVRLEKTKLTVRLHTKEQTVSLNDALEFYTYTKKPDKDLRFKH